MDLYENLYDQELVVPLEYYRLCFMLELHQCAEQQKAGNVAKNIP